jgi:hypothetical protein
MAKFIAIIKCLSPSALICLLCGISVPAYTAAQTRASTAELTPQQVEQLKEITRQRLEALEQLLSAQHRLVEILTQQAKASIANNWSWPAGAENMPTCAATISVLNTGTVETIAFDSPCATQELQASIEAAIIKSSPLPPSDLLAGKRIVLQFQARDGG